MPSRPWQLVHKRSQLLLDGSEGCLESLVRLLFSPKWGERVLEDLVLCKEVAPGWWQTVEQGSSDSCCAMDNYMLEEVRKAVWRQFHPLIVFFFLPDRVFLRLIRLLYLPLLSWRACLCSVTAGCITCITQPLISIIFHLLFETEERQGHRGTTCSSMCVWCGALKGHILSNGSMLTISVAFFLPITFPFFS